MLDRYDDWTFRVANYPAYSRTAGNEIIDLLDGLGRPLDPWQQFVIRHGLGQVDAPEPQWAADTCGCWVPRQNGKGDIIMALELGWLFLFGEKLVVHSAHEYKTAQEGYLRIKGLVEESPDLDPAVNRYWQANGEQGIELTRKYRKARLRFMARTRGAGRGFSAGKIVLDEAQELTEAHMKAILFVKSAQINPQLWFFGTPPDDPAAWIYNLKEAGERRAPRTAWFDSGIEEIDPDDLAEIKRVVSDPATWYRTNPAMRIGRLTPQTIEGEINLMSAGLGFAMERCGMWLPKARDANDRVILDEDWRACYDPRLLATEDAIPEDIALAFAVNPKRTHATIMYAGMRNGKWQVGVIAHKRGTKWLLQELVEACEMLQPIAVTVDAKSETTIDDLAELGIRLPEVAEEPKRGDLILPSMSDVATAFGMLVDAANHHNLIQLDELPLSTAITAPPRPLAGGSTWDHKAGIEVGPANCAGLAMWAYRERIEKIKNDYDPLGNIY